MSAAIDYLVGGDAGYTGDMLPGDQGDNAKMQAFYGGDAAGVPWWQQLVSYGAVRAIDNKFGANNLQQRVLLGNTYPGSLAGQNGGTYTQGQYGNVPNNAQRNGPNWTVIGLLGAAAVAGFALLTD